MTIGPTSARTTGTNFEFTLDASSGAARAARFATPHGVVESPAFMAVGTLATVKALDPDDLRAMGAQMILANAYHLHLRPGDELGRALGGFQVFSLGGLRTIGEDGVASPSHIDGSSRRFTPEGVMRIERNLGADVIM